MELLDIDKTTLENRGIDEVTLNEQLEMLREGFPFLKIEAPATVGNGIFRLSDEMQATSLSLWEEFLSSGG